MWICIVEVSTEREIETAIATETATETVIALATVTAETVSGGEEKAEDAEAAKAISGPELPSLRSETARRQ